MVAISRSWFGGGGGGGGKRVPISCRSPRLVITIEMKKLTSCSLSVRLQPCARGIVPCSMAPPPSEENGNGSPNKEYGHLIMAPSPPLRNMVT